MKAVSVQGLAGRLIYLVLAGLLVPASATANFFFVDSSEDTVDAAPGDGLCADASANCTLRAAVMEANTLAGMDFIDIPAGTYRLSIPGNAEHAAASGDLDILDAVTIRGVDPATTVIDADGIDRVFELINAGSVTISRLTVQNGVAGQNTPGYFVNYAGGGIFNVGNSSTLTLTEVDIRNNSARIGGGVYNIFSTTEVYGSAIHGNAATAGSGGGIAEGLASYVRVFNSTISGNSATLGGGGMVTSNNAAILNNVTITANIADSDNDGSGDGGGIARGITAPQISNTILAGNLDPGGEAPDCSDSITSAGYNLVGNNSGCAVTPVTGDRIGSGAGPLDPALAPLADNGGMTVTHALLNGSPALDGGNPATPGSGSGACEATDQRGTSRSSFAPCDMGALETTPSAGVSFTVNSLLDQVDAVIGDGLCETAPGNTLCTLRAAIQETNALIGADQILLPAGTYTLSIPGSGENIAASGDLDITDSVELTGAGNATTIIDANYLDRVFETGSSGNITLSGITMRNGAAVGGGANGGAIFHQSSGVLTVNDCLVTGNSAASGGGIFTVAFNDVVINRTVISNNTATSYGGGLANFTFSTSTITDSTISGNRAAVGGGIMNSFLSYAVIQGSTISNNQAQSGGGIGTLWGNGIITISNSTLSGNRASVGGGGINVSANDTINLRNSTITANRAVMSADGGGINNSGLVNLRNTIVAGNSDDGGEAPDCIGALTSQGNNLLGDNTACSFAASGGDIVGDALNPVDPLLAPLGDNGGLSLTHTLLPGSPAFNAGNAGDPGSGGSACELLDQRGTSRLVNAPCDIGAVESVLADLSVTASVDASPVLPGTGLQYRIDVENLGPDSANELTLNFTLASEASLLGTLAEGWSCSTSGARLTCTAGSLVNGGSTSIYVSARAPDTSGGYAATASITAASLDLVSANNDTITTVEVNAAPVFNTLATPTYTQGDAGILIAEDASISDVDDTQLQGATISIVSGFVTGQDELRVNGTGTISAYWDAGAGQLVLSGTDTLDAYQAMLRTVQYINTDPLATPGSRTIAYQVDDGDTFSITVNNVLELLEAVPEPVIEPSPAAPVAAPGPAPVPAQEPEQSSVAPAPASTGRPSIPATAQPGHTELPPADAPPEPEEMAEMATEIETGAEESGTKPPQDAAPAARNPSTVNTARNASAVSRTANPANKRALQRNEDGPRQEPAATLAEPGNPGIQVNTDAAGGMVSLALWAELDSMKQHMQSASDKEQSQEQLIVGTAKSVTVMLFAGIVNWYLKAGSLLASLLSSAPLWTPFDPLPILSLSRSERLRRRGASDPDDLPDWHDGEPPDALFETDPASSAAAPARSVRS